MSGRVSVLLLAAAGFTCSIGASAPLIEATNGSGPAVERSHAPVIGELLADPTASLAFKAVEFADPVVQLATRKDEARPGDGSVTLATVATTGAAAPARSAELWASADAPDQERTQTGAVGGQASPASDADWVASAIIAALCLAFAGCLVLGLAPIIRALSTHKQRKRWRAIRSRLVDAARGR